MTRIARLLRLLSAVAIPVPLALAACSTTTTPVVTAPVVADANDIATASSSLAAIVADLEGIRISAGITPAQDAALLAAEKQIANLATTLTPTSTASDISNVFNGVVSALGPVAQAVEAVAPLLALIHGPQHAPVWLIADAPADKVAALARHLAQLRAAARHAQVVVQPKG
jgi:hypothetical protein